MLQSNFLDYFLVSNSQRIVSSLNNNIDSMLNVSVSQPGMAQIRNPPACPIHVSVRQCIMHVNLHFDWCQCLNKYPGKGKYNIN